MCIYTQHFVQPGTHLFSLFFSCFPFEASLSGQLFCKAYDLAHLAPNLSLLKSVLLVTWRCCSSAFALLGLSSRCERLTFVFVFFFFCVCTRCHHQTWLSQPAKVASNSWELAWDQSAYLIQVCVLVLGMSGSSWPGAGLFIPEPYILLWHSSFNLLSLSACTQQPRLVFRLSLPSLCSLRSDLFSFALRKAERRKLLIVYSEVHYERGPFGAGLCSELAFLCAIQQRASSSGEAKIKENLKGSVSIKSSTLDYICMWAHCTAMYYHSLWKKLR